MKTLLQDIVGKENVQDEPQILSSYSSDQSFVEPRMPQWVVFPQTTAQIQDLVKVGNQKKIALIPYSSGLNLHGATIPDQGGIIVNMSHMNRVLEVDERNWWAVIEPGVTYGQLQNTLAPLGLRAMAPLGVPPTRSVISSQMERDPNLAYASFEYGADRMLDIELILPEGDLYRTGGWGACDKPKGSFNLQHRFWTGAQGTLGIVSKMGIKLEHLPADGRAFFLGFDSLEEAIAPLRMIQRKEIGLECFMLNRFNLAAMATKSWEVPAAFPTAPKDAGEFLSHRKDLPQWTMIVVLSAAPYFPEEKFAYEEEALTEIASKNLLFDLEVVDTLPGTRDTSTFFVKEVLRPWSILKKFNYKGSVHDVSFKAPLKEIPLLMNTVARIARQHEYPAEDLGGYVLPIERGRAGHCEFEFHCSPTNEKERQQVKELWLEASRALIEAGAFFDRPYGPWADMVFSRAGTYTQKLKELKKALDPNNVMNPGKLCFS